MTSNDIKLTRKSAGVYSAENGRFVVLTSENYRHTRDGWAVTDTHNAAYIRNDGTYSPNHAHTLDGAKGEIYRILKAESTRVTEYDDFTAFRDDVTLSDEHLIKLSPARIQANTDRLLSSVAGKTYEYSILFGFLLAPRDTRDTLDGMRIATRVDELRAVIMADINKGVPA
jgi:hypothetical protein